MPNTKKTMINLVNKFTEEEQKKIAQDVCTDYKTDIDDRSEWSKKRKEWYELWACVTKDKTSPWVGASNVCLPMLATAVNQFHARTYQSMFAAPKFVKTLAVGELDVDRSKMVEHFMNWQIQYDMEEYEEVMDKLLLQLPINGIAFKKVTYNPDLERPVTSYIHPLDLVLPYKTKSLETARRITHRIWLHYDELLDRNDKKLYENFDKVSKVVSEAQDDDNYVTELDDKIVGEDRTKAEANPHLILECHKKLEIKGKRVPVIITIDYSSSTVLRITRREIKLAGSKATKVLTYFIDYHFIPNPNGFYSFGLGHFLKNLNDMANTAFNQIFDAGSISNMPFGFYQRSAGLKKSDIKLRPGKMIEVNDPTKINFPQMQRIDSILFQVLGTVQKYAEQFTSTTDYIMGREAQGTQNPTARGTLALIEQGLVTFSVITKRTYRGVKKELKLIFDLNQIFLPDSKEFIFTEDLDKLPFPDIKRKDFDTKFHIIPLADPTHASRSGRRQEVMELYQVMMTNPLIAGGGEGSNQPPDLRAIHGITTMLLDTYNDRDISSLLSPLPPESLIPVKENSMFMQGDYKNPSPGEEHTAHLKVHRDFVNTPYFAGMQEGYKDLVRQHIEVTLRMEYEEAQQNANLGGQ